MLKIVVNCLVIGLTCLSQFAQSQGLDEFVQRGWITPKEPVTFFLEYPEQLQRVYASHDYQRIWNAAEDRRALEQQLALIQAAGVSPLLDRQLKYLRLYHGREDWQRYDLLATDALLLYLQYAHYAPTRGPQWFFQRPLNAPLPAPNHARMAHIQRAIGQQALASLLQASTPQNEAYHQLVAAYWRLHAQADTHLPIFSIQGELQRGQVIHHKAVLLQRLALVNIDTGLITHSSSRFGAPLENAIKQFQRMHGLTPHGRLDKATLDWLNMSVADRQYLLALNAQRMRLWPQRARSYVQVNIPAYHMQYWYQGEVVFDAKVIVGRKSRPTPVMTAQLQTVVLNPTWNVPYRIMMDDILPKVRQNSQYLDSHQLEIIKSWRNPEPVSVQSIDWAQIDGQGFPYRLRQKAGQHNSLGEYKFVTPNSRSIYLHDTPHKYLFTRRQRAFSSGCVRVEHADQFARILMSQPGTPQAVEPAEHRMVNHRVRLQQAIPTHLIYQTVWYAKGQLHYRPDIYHYDVGLKQYTAHSI